MTNRAELSCRELVELVTDYLEDALPGYFEVQASVLAVKPTGGWNANSFIIFDYQAEDDFKFAGIDVSLNKLVMGHRDAGGWQVDEQAPVKGGLKADKYYNMLLAVNGVNATLVIDNKMAFTHTYAPRIVDGYSYGLNWGMVGVGSNNARGAFDNIQVQVLPPQVTFNEIENFTNGGPDPFEFNVENGAWSLSGGRYGVTPNGSAGISLVDLGPDNLAVSSYLELNAKVSTSGRAGFVFDRYDDGSFKFAALDAAAGQVIIGHYTAKSGWVSDATVAKTIGAGDSTLGVTLKGTTVSVTLNGQTVLGYAFNATTVDGRFGLLASGGQASFDDLRVMTDDPAFADSGGGSMIAAASDVDSGSASTLTQSELDAIATVVMSQWTDALGAGDARLAAFADVRLVIGDLADGDLGDTQGNTIVLDADAAGAGWFVDVSPAENSEFRVRLDRNVFAAAPDSAAYDRFDLVTVVTHELGHMLGFDHDDAGQMAVMNDALDAGVRYTLDSGVVQASTPPPAATGPSQPTAGAITFDYNAMYSGATGSNAGIEWQSTGAGNWGVQLSPYTPPGPANFASPNLAEFALKFGDGEDGTQPAGFDSMGQDLLGGKGKTKR